MAELENVVTALVASLAFCERAFGLKTIDLRDRPGFSSVTHEFEIRQDALSISGYVDAALEGARGVVWSIYLWRRESHWVVDRGVTLYPNEGDDVFDDLPAIECDSEELAHSLPRWTDELLNLPVPQLPTTGG